MLSKKEKLARLKIIRSESIGPSTFWNLISLYGSGEKAIQALPILVRSAKRAFDICSDEKIEQEQEAMEKIGAEFVFLEDEFYPPLLRNISDPPPLLTMLGKKENVQSFFKKNIISVVGSRNSSIHANKFCTFLCEKLSNDGVVVVSGMARGIDTCAHVGSLKNGTIAILAGGINIVYPQENEKLYKEIVENGCIFTEMPFNTTMQPQLFPRRNRIIAGISSGTVVIEAAEQSGSLITARFAAEYGREIFAVPGFPLDPRSVGCNNLLKDGATLVQRPQDVLDCFENRKIIQQSLFEDRPVFSAKISEKDLEKTRQKILESLNSVPITIDELISSIKIPPQEVLTALIELELADKISRLHGQRVCLSLSNAI
ncbi:DNA processing protein DprA [Alphaproteobacteria bacterium]|nr:DNA processing protein DprA [Alphaproteobacteria bacterium]